MSTKPRLEQLLKTKVDGVFSREHVESIHEGLPTTISTTGFTTKIFSVKLNLTRNSTPNNLQKKGDNEAMISWSPSRLGTADSCLLKYEYSYVPLRKQKGEELPTLNFGQAMHQFIDLLHQGPNGKFTPAKVRPFYYKTIKTAADAWKGYWLAFAGVLDDPRASKTVQSLIGKVDRSIIRGVKPNRNISWDFEGQVYAMMNAGWQMVYDYVVDNWYSAPPARVEFHFTIPWMHPSKVGKWFTLTGRIDQIRQWQDGSFIIYDLKTDRRDYSREKNQVAIGQSHQFTIYALAALHHPELRPYFKGQDAVTIVHYNLRKHRDDQGSPKENFFTTTRGPEEFKQLAYLLETKEAELSLGEYPPTAQSHQCPYCIFRKICSQGRRVWAGKSGDTVELPFPDDYPHPPPQPRQLRLRLKTRK